MFRRHKIKGFWLNLKEKLDYILKSDCDKNKKQWKNNLLVKCFLRCETEFVMTCFAGSGFGLVSVLLCLNDSVVLGAIHSKLSQPCVVHLELYSRVDSQPSQQIIAGLFMIIIMNVDVHYQKIHSISVDVSLAGLPAGVFKGPDDLERRVCDLERLDRSTAAGRHGIPGVRRRAGAGNAPNLNERVVMEATQDQIHSPPCLCVCVCECSMKTLWLKRRSKRPDAEPETLRTETDHTGRI